MRLADYAQHLLSLAETVHRWLGALGALDAKRRRRVAKYAEKIAATLARAGEALHRLEGAPRDGKARDEAIRELGASRAISRPSSAPSTATLTGASLPALKGGWSSSGRASCTNAWYRGRKPRHIERLASAEGYFRALADGLRT